MSAPISILLCALGGEGGGVLADWLVTAARFAGLPAQATSIPGVAQRTGATTYYLEIYPEAIAAGSRKPVLGLNPLPGRLDLLVSSELLETARQVANGLPSADRTLIISNSERVLTTAEKMVMGDGRRDQQRLREIVLANSRDRHVVDMSELTREAGTVVSAVMLGCIAGSGALPLAREHFDAVLAGEGATAKASRRGFDLGFSAVARSTNTEWRSVSRQSGGVSGGVDVAPGASSGRPPPTSVAVAEASRSSAAAGTEPSLMARASTQARAQAEVFPEAVRPLAALGIDRLIDYQGAGYAALYVDRLQRVLQAEREGLQARGDVSGRVDGRAEALGHQGAHVDELGKGADHPVTVETARWLALWMAFDDVIRVAGLKSAPERLERVRREAGAGPDDLLRVYDHFKPGIPEIAGLLPAPAARWLLARDRRRIERGQAPWALPLRIGTHSLAGLLVLRLLASMRVMRPIGSRYAIEQRAIDDWLDAIGRGARENPGLGLEVARCGRLIKGYGSTNERGKRNLAHVLEHLARTAQPAEARRIAIAQVREAALADEAGRALDEALRAHGAPARPVEAKPVLWMKNPRTGRV